MPKEERGPFRYSIHLPVHSIHLPPVIYAPRSDIRTTVKAQHCTRDSEGILQIKTTVEDCVETLVHKLNLINYREGFLGSKYGYGFPGTNKG